VRTDTKATSNQSISLVASINSLLFIGLNISDAWLTKQVLVMGWQEANPVVSSYGTNMVIKGFLALAIVILLVRFGKTKLLWVLNVCWLGLVFWLGAGVLGFI